VAADGFLSSGYVLPPDKDYRIISCISQVLSFILLDPLLNGITVLEIEKERC